MQGGEGGRDFGSSQFQVPRVVFPGGGGREGGNMRYHMKRLTRWTWTDFLFCLKRERGGTVIPIFIQSLVAQSPGCVCACISWKEQRSSPAKSYSKRASGPLCCKDVL